MIMRPCGTPLDQLFPHVTDKLNSLYDLYVYPDELSGSVDMGLRAMDPCLTL